MAQNHFGGPNQIDQTEANHSLMRKDQRLPPITTVTGQNPKQPPGMVKGPYK